MIKKVPLNIEPVVSKEVQQSIILNSEDFLCPDSIELEDDVVSVKTNTDSIKAPSNGDAHTAKSDIVSVLTSPMQHETLCRTVPEQLPTMTILQFVDLVTVMRSKDVHSPISAILTAHITQLNLSVHSFKLICPNCQQSKTKRGSGEGARCATCKTFFPAQRAEQEVMFTMGIMDDSGELYDLRTSGSAAMEFLNSQDKVECIASNANLLRNRLLFNKFVFEVKATWNETFKQPVAEIISTLLIHS